MRGSPKNHYDVLALCDRAADALRAAGFERVTVSMRTEATYWRLPRRHGLLRVAAHKSKKSSIGLGDVVARLTFHGNRFDGASVLVCSNEKVDTMIAIAVGQYVLRSAVARPSEYRGKRGTWENSEFLNDQA